MKVGAKKRVVVRSPFPTLKDAAKEYRISEKRLEKILKRINAILKKDKVRKRKKN